MHSVGGDIHIDNEVPMVSSQISRSVYSVLEVFIGVEFAFVHS